MLGNKKDQVSRICRYRTNLGEFRHHRTMILKVYINGHETCRQKPGHQCSTMIYGKHNSILYGQKNYSIHYLTGQNRGLSRLKNIWPVIKTGDLLSVILSPETSGGHKKCLLFSHANNLYKNKKIHPPFNDKKVWFTELEKSPVRSSRASNC